MTSGQDESDFDFLDEIEPLSQFFTQVTYNFISHTNKFVDGSRIRAVDIKKFSDDEWREYFQDHVENYKLICSDFFEDEFVFVDKKKGKTQKEFVTALKKLLLEFSSNKSEEIEEVVYHKEINEEGKKASIQNEQDEMNKAAEEKTSQRLKNKQICELSPEESCEPESKLNTPPTFEITDLQIEDLQQSTEAENFINLLSDMLDSLKKTETQLDPDGDQEEQIVIDYIKSLDEGCQKGTSSVEVFPSPVAAESILNLNSQADTRLTNSGNICSMNQEVCSGATVKAREDIPSPVASPEPLESSFDVPDERDFSFEQKFREEKEKFAKELAEKRLKRKEKQREHEKELREQEKALYDLKSSLRK
ncbi:unnamed protein product [Caenorhabditis brenneri]